MRDEEIGGTGFLLNILQKINDLRLNRNIQRRDALIRDDQVRIHNQRPGDAYTLPLSAGKLVRIPVVMLRGKTDLLQDTVNFLLPFLFRRVHLMDVQTFANDVADGLSGIQRRHRILENHHHFRPKLTSGLIIQLSGDLSPFEIYLSSGRRIQPDHGPSDG